MTNQFRNDDQSRNREQEGQYSSGSAPNKQQDTTNKNKDKEKESKYSGGSTGSQTGSSQGSMNDKPSGSNNV